jgi:FixJ family two-component response regulator
MVAVMLFDQRNALVIYAIGCEGSCARALRSAFAEIDFGEDIQSLFRKAPKRPITLAFFDFDEIFAANGISPPDFLEALGKMKLCCPCIGIGKEKWARMAMGKMRSRLADWVFKPLRPAELQMRVDLALSAPERLLKASLNRLNSFSADLTQMECHILAEFLSQPGMQASRADLMSAIWSGQKVNPKTLDVHLFNLRKKIAAEGYQIEFHRKIGAWQLSPQSRFAFAGQK